MPTCRSQRFRRRGVPDDKARLEGVADRFATGLTRFGLDLIEPREIHAAEEDGWFVRVANWASRRPRVSVWLDKWLETPERHFWFGFQGTEAQVKNVHGALSEYEDEPLVYDESRAETQQFSLETVK